MCVFFHLNAIIDHDFILMHIALHNTGRSPIYSHICSTLQGLTTIRACNASKTLENEFHMLQDHNTSCYFMFYSASRWFALWLDITSSLYSTFVIYSFLVLQNGMYYLVRYIFRCFTIGFYPHIFLKR